MPKEALEVPADQQVIRIMGTTSWSKCVLVGLVLLLSCSQCTSLMCYTCFNLDCPASSRICADIRSFMVTELKTLYSFSSIPPCPDTEDLTTWKLMQVSTDPSDVCRAEHMTPSCALSRMQVLTQLSDDEVVVSHGTVMGCAKKQLSVILANYHREFGNNKCAVSANNATSMQSRLHYRYEIETCPYVDICSEDFCINPKKSVVKPFLQVKKDKSFDFGLTMLIVAIVLVVLITAILSTWCVQPLNRPSNYSAAD